MNLLKRLGIHRTEILILFCIYLLPIIPGFINIGDNLFLENLNRKDGSIYWGLSIGMVFSSIVFFGNAFILIPNYLSKQLIKAYLLRLIAMMSFVILAESGLKELVESFYNLPANLSNLYDFDNISSRDIGAPAFVSNSVLLLLSFLYRFSRDWALNEQLKNKLKTEKLATELKFLRAQINPHFLFNTLNNIYSITTKNNDVEASNAITKLSGLMRYMLYDSNVDQIVLNNEIEYIHNFIEIQKLRFLEDEIEVSFEISGNIESIEIAPLLLIPFIENAFKHGIEFKKTSLIKISLTTETNRLEFNVKNPMESKPDNQIRENSGIGIKNVKKRLALIYPNKHTLVISEDNDEFKINLTIDLS